MIISDCHMHSDFSSDSDSPMESMVRASVEKKLKYICFTDHMDYDFPKQYPLNFEFDPDLYETEVKCLQDKYKDKIRILYGVEAGMRPYLSDRFHNLISAHPYDFVLCSTHLVMDLDPYYEEIWNMCPAEEVILKGYEDILSNIQVFNDFDAYAHLDYVVRYCPLPKEDLSLRPYMDIIEAILSSLIKKDKALEVNTAGFKYGLSHPHPREEILSLYKELGGSLITIGSDAHRPEHIAYDFVRTEKLLKTLGFKEYAIYRNRTPFMQELR